MQARRFRIVIVEDAEGDIFLVREALQGAGLDCEFEVFEDGEQAVEFIERIEGGASLPCPDLLLLDLNLPRLSGSQVLERVRRSSACSDVPVIILTSSDSPKDKAQAAELKATHYFRKPSQLEEFMKLGPLVRGLLLGRAQAEPKS